MSESVPKNARALAKLGARAITATPAEIERYAPRDIDVEIASALSTGQLEAVTFKAISEELGCTAQKVSNALKEPVACAWIYKMVHDQIRHRLGLVDAAMLQRAVNGDTRAAQLIYKRYDQLTDRSVTAHVHGSVGDFAQFDDESLDALIASHHKAIDVEVEVKDE